MERTMEGTDRQSHYDEGVWWRRHPSEGRGVLRDGVEESQKPPSYVWLSGHRAHGPHGAEQNGQVVTSVNLACVRNGSP